MFITRKSHLSLALKRKAVTDQGVTDTLTAGKVIDLDFRELRPVITITPGVTGSRLMQFSGRDSLGNIDWLRARWSIPSAGVYGEHPP